MLDERVNNNPKPGYKTSEFMVLVVGIALAALNERLGLGADDMTIGAVAAAISAYILSRSVVKATKGKK